MEKIIISLVIVGLFIFFVYFLVKLYQKEKVKKEDKPPEKVAEKESEKEEIPAILKEITMGNYMHDMSKDGRSGEIEMEEDNSIQMPEMDNIEKVEKAFDDINDINIDIDLETEEIDDIEDELLNNLEDDLIEDEENVNKGKSIADEYKGLSKNMKALIIANFLEKKNK